MKKITLFVDNKLTIIEKEKNEVSRLFVTDPNTSMKFTEFLWQYYGSVSLSNIDFDVALVEYNAYLSKQQNAPITSEFLVGLGFEESILRYYYFNNNSIKLLIDFAASECTISENEQETEIPFPKSQKDVLDLMRLLGLN